jgi:hypothetical protein
MEELTDRHTRRATLARRYFFMKQNPPSILEGGGNANSFGPFDWHEECEQGLGDFHEPVADEFDVDILGGIDRRLPDREAMFGKPCNPPRVVAARDEGNMGAHRHEPPKDVEFARSVTREPKRADACRRDTAGSQVVAHLVCDRFAAAAHMSGEVYAVDLSCAVQLDRLVASAFGLGVYFAVFELVIGEDEGVDKECMH